MIEAVVTVAVVKQKLATLARAFVVTIHRDKVADDELAQSWRDVRHRPMLWTDAEVAAHAKDMLALEPAQGD